MFSGGYRKATPGCNGLLERMISQGQIFNFFVGGENKYRKSKKSNQRLRDT